MIIQPSAWRLFHIACINAFLVTLFTVSAALAQTCSPGNGQVAFFKDDGFRGACSVRSIGDYPNPSAMGIDNDSVSSIRLGANVQVEVCKDDRFRGRCEVFTGSDRNLGDNPIGHDEISSARVTAPNAASRCTPGRGSAALFEDRGFKGDCRVLAQGDYPTPQAMGFREDIASSIRVASDSSILVCEDRFFRGRCQRINGDTANLGNEPIGGDKISSVKILGRQQSATCRPAGDEIALFEHDNFRGACAVIAQGEYVDETAMGFAEDTVSSVRIGASAQLVIYRDRSFRGDGERLTQDVANMNQTRIGHDRVSSIRVQPLGARDCVVQRDQVAFYHHRDFVAPCRVEEIGDYPRVASDIYSSIDVGRDVDVIFCEDRGFMGDCERSMRDFPNLNSDNRIGDDDISSYRVVPRNFRDCPAGPNEVSFYEHRDFVGPCVTKPEGDYPTHASLDKRRISSLRVGEEVQACVCSGQQFGPRCEVHTSRVSDLRGRKIGDNFIRSARVQPRGAECKPVVTEPTEPATQKGVQALNIFNCLPRDVFVWTLNRTPGATFKSHKEIKKFDGNGACPTATTPAMSVKLDDKTLVEWVVVDVDDSLCKENDPRQPSCQRNKGLVRGDKSGVFLRVLVECTGGWRGADPDPDEGPGQC